METTREIIKKIILQHSRNSGDYLPDYEYENVITEIITKLSIPIEPPYSQENGGHCRECKFENESICTNPDNRTMLILNDDENFYIYPKFGCNKFSSRFSG